MPGRIPLVFVGAFLLGGAWALGGCEADPPGLQPPRLVAVEKMVGALHVSWANPSPACDVTEVERRTLSADGTAIADFALAYTLPGAADNKHDASATENVTYEYRLRCEKAGRYSDYSNQISANPLR